jgi:putative flippase GtrA
VYHHRVRLMRFGIVGICGLITDVGVFNLLRFAGGHGPLYHQPLTAKVISTSLAIIVAWLGHRFWTFREKSGGAVHREFLMFLMVSVMGLVISVAPLAVSYYLLGLSGPLADNISANVIGLGLSTAFRYWAMHKFVFNETKPPAPPSEAVRAHAPSGVG